MAFIEIYNIETMTGSGTNITDWINLACVFTASCVAVYGINSWRRETRWKKRDDQKEEVTVLLYELIDVLREIRHPYVMPGEGDSIKINKDEKFNNLVVVRERYNTKQEFFAKLRGKKYRVMALFGKEIEPHFRNINKIINEIFISARLLDAKYYPKLGIEPEPNKEVFEKFLTELEHHESVIFWQGEDDTHEKKTNKIIDDFIEALNKLK